MQDPAAQIEAGSGSHPFTGAGSFSPCGDLVPITLQCTGIIALYNATSGYLTSITLDAGINSGLTVANNDSPAISLDGIVFTCDGSSFFGDCSLDYNGATGLLAIAFSAVPDSTPQGIPPLLPGCLPNDIPTGNPDSPGCNVVGHFAFNFLDLEIIDGIPTEVNGWTDPNNARVFCDTPSPGGCAPTFDVTSTDSANPEPATSTLLAAGLLSLALLCRWNYFSRSSRS